MTNKVIIKQNDEEREISEKEAYDKVNEINKNPDKEAKIIENKVIVKDVLRG